MPVRCYGCQPSNGEKNMHTRLDYRDGFLRVVTESVTPHQSLTRQWYPVDAAERAEVETLCGRPLTNINPMEGIYVDEESNVFQLENQGEPLEVETLVQNEERKADFIGGFA
jgi:hypothetical protein